MPAHVPPVVIGVVVVVWALLSDEWKRDRSESAEREAATKDVRKRLQWRVKPMGRVERWLRTQRRERRKIEKLGR